MKKHWRLQQEGNAVIFVLYQVRLDLEEGKEVNWESGTKMGGTKRKRNGSGGNWEEEKEGA